MSASAEHGDVRTDLLSAWCERCRRRGVETAHVGEPAARYLVDAVVAALSRGSETPELGRSARTWGARFTSPVDALAAVTCLREVLSTLGEGPAPGGLVLAAGVDRLPRVIDQLMLESVDAAAGTLRASARIDPLTGCANRRALQEELPHAVASARRSGLEVSLAMIDLDGLKAINDQQGHPAGDATLISLVVILRSALRDLDSLYRSGGDEFVIVSPFTDDAGSRRMLERAEALGGPPFSWGVASLGTLGPQSPDDPERLLFAADADLYARRRARRQVSLIAARRRRVRTVASVAGGAALTATAAYGMAAVADTSFPTLKIGAPVPNAQSQNAGAGHEAAGGSGGTDRNRPFGSGIGPSLGPAVGSGGGSSPAPSTAAGSGRVGAGAAGPRIALSTITAGVAPGFGSQRASGVTHALAVGAFGAGSVVGQVAHSLRVGASGLVAHFVASISPSGNGGSPAGTGPDGASGEPAGLGRGTSAFGGQGTVIPTGVGFPVATVGAPGAGRHRDVNRGSDAGSGGGLPAGDPGANGGPAGSGGQGGGPGDAPSSARLGSTAGVVGHGAGANPGSAGDNGNGQGSGGHHDGAARSDHWGLSSTGARSHTHRSTV